MYTIESREPNAQFDLTVSDNMPEIFVDGLSHVMMGPTITKMILHSVVESANKNNGIERRAGAVRITIPTPVLLEMSRNILAAAQSSIEVIAEGGKQIDNQLKNIMEGVSITFPSA